MIARLTRFLLLFQALAVGGVFFLLRQQRPSGSAWLTALLALAILLLVRLLITANNFLLARRYAGATARQHRLTARQAGSMFLHEFAATLISSSWSMPFQTFTARLVPSGAMLPVLLVHGYGSNSGYWHSMSGALKRAQISHRALELEPPGASIDAYAGSIEEAVETLCAESGSRRVILLAHSMGGLATRAWLRSHGRARVAAVITLGTPHYGSGLANFAPGLNSRQMRWQGRHGIGAASPWLQALAAQEDSALRALFISIYSPHDNIVSPRSSCCLPGARNIAFHGIGHVALARDPLIQARVVDEIKRISS